MVARHRATCRCTPAPGAAVLDQQGALTPWIEQALGDFYDSDACKDVLEKALS